LLPRDARRPPIRDDDAIIRTVVTGAVMFLICNPSDLQADIALTGYETA
jgi:hypothetical protein